MKANDAPCFVPGITECLQQDIMVFVNQIGDILHTDVHHSGGFPNKNIGDAFLFVWKLQDNYMCVPLLRVRVREYLLHACFFLFRSAATRWLLHACVRACVRACVWRRCWPVTGAACAQCTVCVHACVRACVRVCVCACVPSVCLVCA